MRRIPLHHQRGRRLQGGSHGPRALRPVRLGAGLLAAVRPLRAPQLVHGTDLEEVVRSCFQVPHGGLVPAGFAGGIGVDKILDGHRIEHHRKSGPLNLELGNGDPEVIRCPPLQRHRETLGIRHDGCLTDGWGCWHCSHGLAHNAPLGMADLVHSADLKPVGRIRAQTLDLQSRFPELVLLLDRRGCWHAAAIPHVLECRHPDQVVHHGDPVELRLLPPDVDIEGPAGIQLRRLRRRRGTSAGSDALRWSGPGGAPDLVECAMPEEIRCVGLEVVDFQGHGLTVVDDHLVGLTEMAILCIHNLIPLHTGSPVARWLPVQHDGRRVG
mmetsp:Transcript_85496/g.228651  ORF Transcript_85496/g.228651 Transcript_85496/m.228651 type:complete len:326 (-) Transcript_85496:470-1447(-)